MIQFQKWEYSPTLTGGQQWAATFIKTIEGEGRDVQVKTSYTMDQIDSFLKLGVLDDENADAMAKAIHDVRGEPVVQLAVGKPGGLKLAA